MSSSWATWANLLTTLRLTLIPATFLAISYSDWWLAAVLFTIAAVSDAYDGKLARRFDQATPFGGLLDHTTDALYVSSGLAAVANLGLVNPYLWPLILIAFSQYMLDSKALAGLPLRASAIGRLNGILYFVLLGVFIGAEALGLSLITMLAGWFGWLLVVTSVISIGDRAWALLRRNLN